jgi:hypothetical protein
VSAGGQSAGSTSGAGSDHRARRTLGRVQRSDAPPPVILRLGDHMTPLAIPREEAPVGLRTYR